jgi:hypothetical protein
MAMSANAVQRLRSGWPLAGVFLSFLVGLAIAGMGGAVLGATLSSLIFGPAYLIQNGVRRRRGTFPVQPPKSPIERAQSDALLLRAGAVVDLAIAIAAIVVLVSRWQWLPGRGGTALLLVIAALGIRSAPYCWALAEHRATQRTLHWAWGVAGALDVVFGATAATLAITNLRSHWIGGSTWTIALAALALLWLLSAPSLLARARSRRG